MGFRIEDLQSGASGAKVKASGLNFGEYRLGFGVRLGTRRLLGRGISGAGIE